jgi:hypothetical protein
MGGFELSRFLHRSTGRHPHPLPEGENENRPGWSPPPRTESGESVQFQFSRPEGRNETKSRHHSLFHSAECAALCNSATGSHMLFIPGLLVNRRIEIGVVVHLQLPVMFEPPGSGQRLPP